MQTQHKVDIQLNDGLLTVTWADGVRRSFHSLWLRDNCPCEKCRHPNGQKLITIADFPADVEVVSATVQGDGLRLKFSAEGGNGEAHCAQFDLQWLRDFSVDNNPPLELWDGKSLSADEVARNYADIHADINADRAALAEWLEFAVRYGVAILRGVPNEPDAVCKVVEWFGFVRETNYGRTFEVKATATPNNLAYTNIGLFVHTDNPYRDPPPGLQLLHCLQNSAAGGDSILVDGFMAADILLRENESHYHQLARHPVPFQFCDAQADLRSRLPVLDVALGSDELRAVNFNPRAIAALDLPLDAQADYYAAYRHFADILQRPELNLRFKMQSGDLFMVDNRRVLHGRTEFVRTGDRHLQGCYADRDALLSTWRIARRS